MRAGLKAVAQCASHDTNGRRSRAAVSDMTVKTIPTAQ